jgi:hypothetical protein
LHSSPLAKVANVVAKVRQSPSLARLWRVFGDFGGKDLEKVKNMKREY